MKKMAGIAAMAAGLLMLALPSLLQAQVLAGITLDRLGVLDLRYAGARPFAMGGAYTALSNDAFGLQYNPAGLAEVTRREFTVGLHFRRDEITNINSGLRAEHSSDNTSLDHAAVVYPYPTFRGSMVFALGVFRVGTSGFEFIKNDFFPDLNATVEHTYKQSGDIFNYDIGMAFDLSPRIAAGLSLVLWDQTVDFTEEIDQTDPDSALFYRDDVSLDLDGFSFNVGLLFRPSDATRIGLSFSSPAWLTYTGEGVTTLDGDFTAGGGFTTEPVRGRIDDDYTLPLRIAGGASARISQLLLSADVGWTDWSQTKYNGEVITDETEAAHERVLKAKFDVHAGAELSAPWFPAYVRGGFSYEPLPIETVEEIAFLTWDATAANDVPTSLISTSDITKDRTFWTVGVGGLVDRVLSLDAALSFGGFERVTRDVGGTTVFSEKRTITEFIVSGSYRF
jgi:hypothetical protein